MKITMDIDPRPDGMAPSYTNVKGYLVIVLTEKDGKYKLSTEYGYGELTNTEYDDAKIQAMVEQFGLYWQDAKMWMKEDIKPNEKS